MTKHYQLLHKSLVRGYALAVIAREGSRRIRNYQNPMSAQDCKREVLNLLHEEFPEAKGFMLAYAYDYERYLPAMAAGSPSDHAFGGSAYPSGSAEQKEPFAENRSTTSITVKGVTAAVLRTKLIHKTAGDTDDHATAAAALRDVVQDVLKAALDEYRNYEAASAYLNRTAAMTKEQIEQRRAAALDEMSEAYYQVERIKADLAQATARRDKAANEFETYDGALRYAPMREALDRGTAEMEAEMAAVKAAQQRARRKYSREYAEKHRGRKAGIYDNPNEDVYDTTYRK